MSNTKQLGPLAVRRTKACLGNYNKYIKTLNLEDKDSYRNVIWIMDEKDVGVWYGLAFNLISRDRKITNSNGQIKYVNDKEFEGGEYIIKLTASKEFPFKPPVFSVLTPNGVFDDGTNPCISIGHYHEKDSILTLGLVGFGQVIADSIGEYVLFKNGGVNILRSSVEKKKELASKSVEYNKNHYPELLERFRNHIIENKLQDRYKLSII